MKIYSSRIKNVNLTDFLLFSQIVLLCTVFEPVQGSVIRLEKNATNLGGVLLNTLGTPFAAASEKVSQQCKMHSESYLEELSKLTPWAIHMYDASTNIPSGLVTGNTQQMGNYDQCLGIEVKNSDNELQFRGQQCRATLQFRRLEAGDRNSSDFDMKDLFGALLKASDSEDWKSSDSVPYTWAICVPSTCSASDVENHFNELLLPLNVENRVQLILSVSPNDCLVASTMDIHFTASQIVIMLTPPYAFVIFFYATLMYHLGSGPNWNSQMGLNRDYCIENWWTNLLYINNYINIDRMCMNQTWYLAVDMQLFWLSPLLLYPLAKWPRFGKALLGFTILGSVLVPLIVTMALRLTAVMLYNKDLLMVGNVYKHVYSRTYTRAGPYFIGIALGYLLHNLRGKPIKIPKMYVVLGWLLAMASCVAVVFGAAVFYNDEHEYSVLESGIYAGLHRSIWALSIAWMAFACIKGYGGPVDTFLSWKLFVPLSRLTYCAYLCHYIVLLYNIGSVRTPGYLSDYHIVHEFSGNFVLSFALAMVISLAFEIPFMNLDKILLRPSHGAPLKMANETNGSVNEANQRKVSYDNIGFNEGLPPENHRVAGVYVISDHNETMAKNLANSAIPLELHKYEN
ncbi:hypothetical protein C0J52_01840 [Blattella germanica]|nr:hypothetical protein C0J52_01840 [Blattella germanica]